MATLRDLGLDVSTDNGRANTLHEQDLAAGMGSLRRGWETGRIGNELNPLRTQALDAEIVNDTVRSQALRAQIGALEQRQQIYAPKINRVEDTHGVGDALSYGAAQVGQGAASMVDPMAVSAGLATAGRVTSAIPHPIAKGLGYAAQGAAIGIPYFMSKDQLQGEFIGEAERDPELLARTSKQGLRDMAGNYGMLAAIPDSAFPGLVGRQISGLTRAGGTAARKAALGPAATTAAGLLVEGGTETLQNMGSQYARGVLNPNRDTSGDFMDNVNSFVGGAVGAGPFAAAGAYAEAGHNRLDAGVDAVKEKAGEVVDMMNESPTVQKAVEQGKKWYQFGKGKAGDVVDLAQQKATDFATGEDGSVSMGNAADKVKDAYNEAASHVISRADEKALASSMDNMDPEAVKAMTPEAASAVLAKDDARRRDVATRLLSARTDETSKQLLEAMQDPQNFDALDDAVDHLRQTSGAASLSQVAGEMTSAMASYAGSTLGSAAMGVGDIAVKFGKGVMQGMRKKNMQSELDLNSMETSDPASPYDNWLLRTTRNKTTLGDEALAQIHTRKGTMAEQAKEDSYRRAVMAGEHLANKAKQIPSAKPEIVDYMRTVAYEINDLADSWGMGYMDKPSDEAMQRQKSGMSFNLDRIAEDLNNMFGKMAGDALTRLERDADPKSAPMFEFLREKVLQGENEAGRAARQEAREAAISQMLRLLPRKLFNQTLPEGGAEKAFRGFEMLARNRAVKGLREHLVAQLGQDTLNKVMLLVSGTAVEGEPEQQMSEPVSEYDQAAAQKKLDKGGSVIYQFRGTLAPRSGGDIFARTTKDAGKSDTDSVIDGEDITRRPQLFKGTTDPKTGSVTGNELMPSGDNMLDFKIKEMEDRVGYKRGETGPGEDPGWNDTHKGYGVDTVPAWDLMKDMTPGRILSLYRDYLRQDSAPGKDKTPTAEQTEAGRKATAVGMLLGRLVSNQQKPAGDPSQWTERQTQEWKKALVLAKETGHKGEGPVFESMDALNDHQSQVTLKEAEAYFREHHIVRAYSMKDNNPLELDKPEAMKMQKKGKKIEDSIRRDADRAEDAESADQIRSDANLLFFPKDGKDVPIAVRDLVLWAKKSSDYAGQTQADDEVSHTPGMENNRYLKALVEAISAYATTHADGLPYKINPGGEQEFFKESREGMIDGIPDSLMLQNKSYAESAAAGELDAKFKSPLTPKRHISRVGPNRNETGDIRNRDSNQAGVQKDSQKQEEFFTAEQREERDAIGDERKTGASPHLTTVYRKDLGLGGGDPNIGPSITERRPNDDRRGIGGIRVDRSGTVAAEAKTDDPSSTELDFSKGQDPKAEADEITNQKWFTQQTTEKYQAPTTAMRGMSSAKHNAAGVLRTMMDDPRAGDREAITLLRVALEPDGPTNVTEKKRIGKGHGPEAFEEVKVKTPNLLKGRTFQAYSVAPLIHLVSNNRETEGDGFRKLTNVQYFENAGATPGLINIIRRGAAQVLIRTDNNINDASRLSLARQLVGDAKITHGTLEKRLQAFLNAEGGRVDVNGGELAVNWGDPSTFPKTEALKVQPALTTTAKQEVAAKPAAPAPTTASAQAEFDSVLADMDKDPTFAFKGAVKPYAESAAGQAAIDRVRAVPDAAEQARRARNAAAKTAAVDPKVAELQAQLDAAIASLQKTTTAATGVAPTKPVAAPKVATPPPEGYVVKAPSADLQSKIDAALPKMDGTYLSAIKAAITRNEMWAASGDAGPNVAKVDIPNLKKWAAMSEAEAKAAAEANNSPNMGRIVKALQAGSTGGPAGKPGGAPAGVKLTGGAYVAKDNVKSEQATKFIGRGSETSSTASYAKQWGARANSGSYTSSDRVFISAEGKRVGRLDPDAAEIGKATAAGATILTDSMTTGRERDYNVGERQVVEILAKNGYTESAPGVWTPTRKRNNQAGGDASIRKLLADAASALDTRTESLRLLNSLSPEDQHTLQNDMLSNKGMSSLLPARMQEGFREWVRDYGKGESAFAWENLHENEVEYLEDILDQREYNDAIDVLMATAILGKNKLNAQTPDGEQPGGTKRNNMVAPVSAELADTRTIMRQLGFKSAPVQFADVAAKLLSDPDQDLAAFVKDSAVGLSHLITAEENFKEIRAALQSDAWLAVRAKIIARLVKGGMMRGDAMVESYRILTEQALTGELIARTKAEKNALAALWQMVRDFVSKFKEVTGSAEFADLVRNKLNELVDKSKGPIDLKKGFAKVTFQQAVDGDPVSAAVLAHVSTNPNIAITGSIVLADKGSIYRKADNMLHDLDLIVTGSKEAAEAHLRKAFPDAKQVYDFQTSNGKVDTFIVPPKGATVENVVKQYGEKGRVMSFEIVKDGKVIGRTWNDADGEHKSGTAGTLVDFFTGTEELPSSTIPFTVGGKQHSMKAMAPGSIFDAKLSMHRDKDITDYLNYVPTLGRKLNAMATAIHTDLGRGGFAATHDSPIRHEGKFDWRAHKGKGEGNAAFGAGTYLSTAEGVHQSYKNQFTASVVGLSAKTRMMQLNGHLKRAQQELGMVRAEGKAGVQARIDSLTKELNALPKSPTYEVSVNIKPEQLLDWDKPLSEQSELVREALTKDTPDLNKQAREQIAELVRQREKVSSGMASFREEDDRKSGRAGLDFFAAEDIPYSRERKEAERRFTEEVRGLEDKANELRRSIRPSSDARKTGAQIYGDLTQKLGSQAKASDHLQSLGILGHKYAAAGGKNDTHPNYVIYDDSKITTNYVHFNKQTPDSSYAEATEAEIAEAEAWLEKVAPGTIFKIIKDAGYSGEFIEATNTVEVSINAAAGIKGTTYHEGLHKFFAQFVRSNPKLQKMFEGFANDPRILNRLKELLQDYPAAQAQLVDGEERLAYAFQFWKAGLLRVDNENRSFMQKIGSIFRRVFGMVRNSEHALAIFQAFDQGKLAVPSTAEKVIAAQLNKGAMALRLRRGLDGLSQGVAAAVLPAETILGQNQHSATARKLSGILFTNPGDEEAGGGQIGYLNAKRSEGKRWLNRANSIFEKMEKGDVDAVQKYMQAQTDPADIKMTVHRDAVIELRKTFEDFHTYMRDSGLKIGKVDKYYPTVWDVDALHKNKSAFIKMLVNKYAQQMNPDGGNAHKAAERIWSALIERNGVDNKAINATRGEDAKKAALREDGVLSPFFAGKEQQTLWWLDGADKEAYLSKNVTYTISQYFHQGVRAAEYQSRFGENGIKLEAMLGKIRKEITNASYELYPTVADDNTGKMHKVELGSKMVDAQMPSDKKLKQGADREKWVGRQMRDISMAVGAIEGTLGKDISPNMRKFNSYMIAYQNIRLLPYMIFSSFVDPLAQVARGAPLNAAWDIFSYGMREVFRAWADMFRDMPKERQKDEWTKLAEHIGAIEVAMFNHHVAEDYSSVYMSPMARKINETLFKMNGMEAWDRANRTMATKWAVRFIEQHRGLPDKAHSQRWLSDLGLTPATIPVNADGQLITTAEELAVVKGITIEDAKQRIAPIHAALNRWVEGAVISPNAAQRPGWSSDPNYASVFHLKQFAYSFQQTIMKRALNELDHGNIRPISTLVAFVPTMLCADLIKGLIQGGGSLPPYMAGMDIGERIAYAAQRGGIFGTGDIGLNAIEDWSSLGGPAFEQIVDGVRDDFGRTAVNAMPLHSMGEYLFSGGKQGIAGPT